MFETLHIPTAQRPYRIVVSYEIYIHRLILIERFEQVNIHIWSGARVDREYHLCFVNETHRNNAMSIIEEFAKQLTSICA